MTKLEIQRLVCEQQAPTLTQISQAVRSQPHHGIRHTSWPGFPYCPDVQFAAAYTDEDLVIHFAVRERAVLAKHTRTNDSVCCDSCVEVFVAPPGRADYINLEFNCIGTVLGQRGSGRNGRAFLSAESLGRIRRVSSLGDQAIPLREVDTEWELVAAVPLALLDLPSGGNLPGVECRANIYKCGDGLPTPHYVSWRPIGTPQPDFHRPEHFGPIVFV